ncbi:MAG: SHOCT domain-containing protein [Candidatus Heimdallarchaeaceae archaeon]
MEPGEHMMDWWAIPFMGYMMIGAALVLVLIAFLIYLDAEKRGMNGLLWFFLVIVPMISVVSIIVYLIIRVDYPVQQPVKESLLHKPQVYQESPTSKITALAKLDERYANGEITREEYYQMKRDIELSP